MAIFKSSVRQKLRERRELKEQAGLSRSGILGLRKTLSSMRWGFFSSPSNPVLRDTTIDRDKSRSLYYNTDYTINLGAHLARPIIDGIADFMDLPILTVYDEQTDAELNNLVQNVWGKALWETWRNCLRDTNTWVRVRLPLEDPLMAPDEKNLPLLEVIDADRVTPYYNPVTGVLERVEILTLVYIEDEQFDPMQAYRSGFHPHGREHEIVETITPTAYTYFDVTKQEALDGYTTMNSWGFVPLVEIFNDYDSALHGGVCEIETVYPFLQALHDLLKETKSAHSYSVNPKLKFKVGDVNNFLRNNFPEAFVDGQFTGKISPRQLEAFYMESEEDVDFIEITSKVSDSTALIELLIDFICMGAEVTEQVLFRARTEGAIESDEFFRFKKKIARKRESFEPYLQKIVRMAMKVSKGNPKLASISWPEIDPADLVTEATAMNQIVTACEVANRSGVITKSTYRAKIRHFFPTMKTDAKEESEAQAEQAVEQQQQIDFEKKLSEAQGGDSANGNGANRNGGGANSSRRFKQTGLPIEVVPAQRGN